MRQLNRLIRWMLPACMIALALMLGWLWRVDASQSLQLPLAKFAIAQVQQLRIDSAQGSATFVRTGDAWRQTKPFEQMADTVAIRQLLATAADTAPVYRVALDQAPAQSRLQNPEATLCILMPDQSVVRYRIGADHPAGLAWIGEEAAGQGGPASPALRKLTLAAIAGALRDDRLFEFVSVDSDRIVIESHDAATELRIELQRAADGWRMQSPFDARADASAVAAFLQGIARVRYQGVVQASAGDGVLHGLAQPFARITVRTLDVGKGEPVEECVRLGNEATGGGRFARINERDPVLALDAKAVAALLPQPANFVDARACSLQPEEVVMLRVLDTEGATRFELQRTPRGWNRRNPDGTDTPIDDRNARELVRSLCEVRAAAITTEVIAPEWLVASLQLSSTAQSTDATRTLRVSRLADAKWAIREGEGLTRLFSANLPMPLQPADHPPKR